MFGNHQKVGIEEVFHEQDKDGQKQLNMNNCLYVLKESQTFY